MALYPYVVRFELVYPFTNYLIPRIHNVSASQPSLIRHFNYLGSYSAVKEATLLDLIQILKLCPGLETLRLTKMELKTEQWERVLGCLDYSRLRTLEIPNADIGAASRRFPVEVLPADAILQELNLYRAYPREPFHTALLSAMAKRLPNCKIVSWEVSPPKSLLHIS